MHEEPQSLADRLLSSASVVSADDRDHVLGMLGSLSLATLNRISMLRSGGSDAAWDFMARMVVTAHKGEGVSKATDVDKFLSFAAEIAPITIHFNSMSVYSVDRWLYMSTVIAKQKGNWVATDDLVAFHRGLVLMLFVDQQSVNGRPDAAHLVWLGRNWPVLESFIPLLIERSSVERSFVESLIDGTNGLPTMSKGIL
jgi:hypothetical protein